MGIRKRVGLLALVTLVALPAVVRAEEDDLTKAVASFRRLLKMGMLKSLDEVGLEVTSEEMKEKLVDNPVAAYHFADAVATYARPTARRAPDAAAKLLEYTLDLGEKVVAKSPDDVSAKWAKAAALVARGRMTLEKREKVDPADWSKAAELVLADAKAGGRANAIAIGYLVEGSELPGADREGFLSAAEKALTDVPEGEKGAMARALVALGRAKSAPAKAKPLLEQAVAALAPLVAKEPPDLEVATLHNSIVTWARSQKVSIKAEYRTKPKKDVGLSFELPVSKSWEPPSNEDIGAILEQAEKGNYRYFGAYRQYDASGNMVRSIRFNEYDWNFRYDFGEGQEAGGDNVKGLCRKGQEVLRAEFSKVASEKDVRKVPFNKTWPQAYVFEIAGVHQSGDEARARLFLFKSDGKQKTYEVEIFEYGPSRDKLDPEAQAFLESISEEPKKK